MADRTAPHITSTPHEGSHLERSLLNLTEDSGYISNYSACTSSTSLLHDDTKHLDSIGQNESSISSEKLEKHHTIKNADRVSSSWQHSSVASPRPNFSGRKYVDFFYNLGDWYHHPILVKKILSYLNDEELYNAAYVSRSWRQIISTIPSEEKRLRSISKKIQKNKENRNRDNQKADSSERFENVRCFAVQTPRNRLVDIQNNQASSSSSISPVDKSKYRFEAYQKEASRVKYGKRLYPCPRCAFPAHFDPKTEIAAECTSCKYRFCIMCSCEEHRFKLCNLITTPVIRRQSDTCCTAKSKKNLKRLLL